MSSYLSNLLTQTTSRYNSLRRTLLPTEDDGDTEDDTHVCRVLRAYYTEKGRGFPGWLPADPKDRRAITPQPYANTGQQGYLTSAGGRSQYGAQQPGGGAAGPGARGGGGLSDLWDSPRASGSAPAPPQSLRNVRRGPGGGGPGGGGGGGGGGPAPMTGNPGLAPPSGPRPLPSQRSGSYQSVSSQQGGMDTGGAASSGGGGGGGPGMGGGSAQDRLKARLWGGARATSPSPGQSGGMPPNQYDASGGQGGRRYGR